MNNSTVNFTTSETSTNSTTQSLGLIDYMEICEYSISFMVGIPTHSYVIWLIITGAASGVASELFNLNLSVCEIVSCLNCLFHILKLFISSITELPMFLLGLVFTARPLFQCLICVERYLAVVHPVTFLKYKPLRYRVICCTVVWIIALGSCLCSMFSFILNIRYGYKWFFSLQFILLLSIQLFCLVAVLRALKQTGPGERIRERKEENHMKKRAFQLILITFLSMFIIHVLFIITGFYSILIKNIQEFWFLSLVCYVLDGFVQPLLYLHRAGKLSCLCTF
ncbi:hydroxycarboxylic acid receptor 2-like [Labeo rohita]|uniref:hydroxycarboxylic acid receptor 2-like n=1 Tax=Labeo rohita TaxID=84645 RepID=UPI0021E2C8D1|nr:hydroxycarboxylic acid receptor 2-like [Labeo rohita]